MSVTVWIVAAALVAAGVAIVALWLVRRARQEAPLGQDEAAQAAATLPGFTVRQALLADDRRRALVVGERGRVALVTMRGRRPWTREVRWSEIRAVEGGLHIEGARASEFVGGVDVLEVRRAGDETWRRRPSPGRASA